MKKIILYLARISGVAKDLRNETISEIGEQIYSSQYWFNSESINGLKKPEVQKTLSLIGRQLKDNHWFDMASIASQIYKTKETSKEIIVKEPEPLIVKLNPNELKIEISIATKNYLTDTQKILIRDNMRCRLQGNIIPAPESLRDADIFINIA